MNDVEERLKRISAHKGVIGTIVMDVDAIPVRTTLDNSTTVQYCQLYCRIMKHARGCVRDIDPTNDLCFLRVRTKKYEVMIAPEKDYLFIVIQNPSE